MGIKTIERGKLVLLEAVDGGDSDPWNGWFIENLGRKVVIIRNP